MMSGSKSVCLRLEFEGVFIYPDIDCLEIRIELINESIIESKVEILLYFESQADGTIDQKLRPYPNLKLN